MAVGVRIIGIDPGAATTGFGVIEKTPRGAKAVAFGEITFEKNTPISVVLAQLHAQMGKIIRDSEVREMALETIFLGKSVRSLVTQAHTRGALILAAQDAGVPVFEHSPLEIKKAVVGYGQAEKRQVQMMVRTILGITDAMSLDTSDALALAICHANSLGRKRL